MKNILNEEFKSSLEVIVSEAKDIFIQLQEELISGTSHKRFKLKNTGKYNNMLHTKNLKNILHISKNLGDGLGFDVLYPSLENNLLKLLKVEVKSSSDGETIYLSENERKQILRYENDEFFKIYLYIKDNAPKDITQLVFRILNENSKFKNIRAETWILNIKTNKL